MTDSGLIVPPHLEKPRTAKRRGGDLATLDEVFNIVGNLHGPIAVMIEQMATKIARLEDRLGITDESIVGEPEPVGTPYDRVAEMASDGGEYTPPQQSEGGDE